RRLPRRTWVLFQNSLPKRNHSKRDGEIVNENLESRSVTCRRSVGTASALRRFPWGAGKSSPGEFRYSEKTLRPNEIIQVEMGKEIIKTRVPTGYVAAPARCLAGARVALVHVLPANFGIMQKLSTRMKSFKQ